MKRNKIMLLLGLLLSSIVFSGCKKGDDDIIGLWDPIEITVNGNECKSSTYEVASTGGVYKIYSKNYGSLWLNAVKEDGKYVWPKSADDLDYRNIHLTTEWYDVQYDTSGNIVVNIQPKENYTSSRSLTFELEAGDAFDTISLVQ